MYSSLVTQLTVCLILTKLKQIQSVAILFPSEYVNMSRGGVKVNIQRNALITVNINQTILQYTLIS